MMHEGSLLHFFVKWFVSKYVKYMLKFDIEGATIVQVV